MSVYSQGLCCHGDLVLNRALLSAVEMHYWPRSRGADTYVGGDAILQHNTEDWAGGNQVL